MTVPPAAGAAGEGWAAAVDPRLVSRLLARRPRVALPARRALDRTELGSRLLPVSGRLALRARIAADDDDPSPAAVPATPVPVQATPVPAATPVPVEAHVVPARARPAAPDARPPVRTHRDPAPPPAADGPGRVAPSGVPGPVPPRRAAGAVPEAGPSTARASAARPVVPARRPTAVPAAVPPAGPAGGTPAAPSGAAPEGRRGAPARAAGEPDPGARATPAAPRGRRPVVGPRRVEPAGPLASPGAAGPLLPRAVDAGSSRLPAVRQVPPPRTRTAAVAEHRMASAGPGGAAGPAGSPAGGVIQPLRAGAAGPGGTDPSSRSDDGPSADELVERVLRRLGREVAVAAERRGLRSGERPGELGR